MSMNTQFSPSAWAFNKVNDALRIKEEDGKATYAGKLTLRATANVATAYAAAVETIALALITAISSTVLNFVAIDTTKSLVSRTQLAADTTVASIKAIAGYGLENKLVPAN